jgi:hypothetical protein
MLSRIGNMRRDPMDPLQSVQDDESGARARVPWCLHGEGSVASLLERIHRHGGARDIAGL